MAAKNLFAFCVILLLFSSLTSKVGNIYQFSCSLQSRNTIRYHRSSSGKNFQQMLNALNCPLVVWRKHGMTCVLLPQDLTIAMDVELNPGPKPYRRCRASRWVRERRYSKKYKIQAVISRRQVHGMTDLHKGPNLNNLRELKPILVPISVSFYALEHKIHFTKFHFYLWTAIIEKDWHFGSDWNVAK